MTAGLNDNVTFDDHALQVLADATTSAFETVVMLDIERVDSDTPEVAAEVTGWMTTLPLRGSLSVMFFLRTTRAAAAAICTSMLMLDPGETVDDEDAADALGEIANLIAGGYKTARADDGLELGTPRSELQPELKPATRNLLRFAFGEHQIQLGVQVGIAG